MDTSVLTVIFEDIIEFFNAVQNPAQMNNAIIDDPNFGKPLPDGISRSLGRRIIKERDSIFQGSFKSLEDIDKISPCWYSLSSLNGAADQTLFEEIEIAVEKIARLIRAENGLGWRNRTIFSRYHPVGAGCEGGPTGCLIP